MSLLKADELAGLAAQVPGWEVVNGHQLHRIFRFPDFQQALHFVNQVGAIAEELGHHPDILLAWGRAEVTTYSHDVDGLTGRDFKLATRVSALIP